MVSTDPNGRPSDEELALAVGESLFDLFRAIADALPGAELAERAGCCVHAASPANPMFKGIWRLRGEGHGLAEAVDDALAWHGARGSPFAFVWAGPGEDAEAISEVMRARGIEAWERDAPGQVARLDELDWAARDRAPRGVAFRVVEDEAGLLRFRDGLVEGFGLPSFAADAWVEATLGVGVGSAPWTFVLAELEGRPVATAVLFGATRVATLFGVATVPDLRGRGIGGAVTLEALRLARERGYREAVLFATESGAPVYRRLGFRDAGVTVDRWLWRAG